MVDNVAEKPINLTEYRLQSQARRYLATIAFNLSSDISVAKEPKYTNPAELKEQVLRFCTLLAQNKVVGKVTATNPSKFGQPKQEEGKTVIPIGTSLIKEFLAREQKRKEHPTTPRFSEKSLDALCRTVPAVLALNPNEPTPIRPTPTTA